MVNFSFNEDSMTLEATYTGILTVEGIISHYTKIHDDKSLPRDLKVFIDISDTQMDLKVDEIAQTYDAVKNAILAYHSIKEAILVDKPYETVVAMLFEKHHSRLKTYSFRVFSTESAARKWLDQS